ncbi:MAG: PEP-CTERM sorting domain-containing protein [Syntrophales bacterium]|jgi:hypothetical protein
MKKTIMVSSLFFILFLSVLAQAATITFDEYPSNNNNQAITNLYSSLGVIFGADNSGTFAGIANGDPGNWGLNGTNGPAFLGNNGQNNNDTYITTIDFTSLISSVSFDVSRSNGSSSGQALTAAAYSAGSLLGSQTITLGDVNQWSTISLNFANIDEVILTGSIINYSPYALDNLQFTSVPEPTSLILLGLGFIGLAGFKKKIKI